MEPIKKLTAELTAEETAAYDKRAAELATSHNDGRKVHPIVQIDSTNNFARSVCYLKEPNYVTKVRIMDKASTSGVYSAAEELREICVIKEESDPITYSEAPESDRFKLGVLDYAIGMISRLQNQFKKK